MSLHPSTRVSDLVSNLRDPRKPINIKHRFTDIIFILLFGLISDCEDIEEIADYSRECEGLLSNYLALPNGIPSHDTLQRVLYLLDENSLTHLLDTIELLKPTDQIGIDGKQIGGKSQYKGNGLLAVNAWCVSNQFRLAGSTVSTKTSEKVAIKRVLELLNIEEKVVTIDAMGTDKELVGLLAQKKAFFILAVKKNQKTLLSEVNLVLEKERTESFTSECFGHGRLEKRTLKVSGKLDEMLDVDYWRDEIKCKQVLQLDTEIYTKKTGKITQTTRFFITNLEISPEKLLNYIRSHWSIEAHLHWCLDVYFGEDLFNTRTSEIAKGLHLIRQFILHKVKTFQDPNPKLKTTKKKLNKAKRSPQYAIDILLS
jgi:predicted transposase YbfD/YdcC